MLSRRYDFDRANNVLLQYHQLIYKFKIKFDFHLPTELPHDEINTEIHEAVLAILHILDTQETFNNLLQTKHFLIECSKLPWSVGRRLIFEADGKDLLAFDGKFVLKCKLKDPHKQRPSVVNAELPNSELEKGITVQVQGSTRDDELASNEGSHVVNKRSDRIAVQQSRSESTNGEICRQKRRNDSTERRNEEAVDDREELATPAKRSGCILLPCYDFRNSAKNNLEDGRLNRMMPSITGRSREEAVQTDCDYQFVEEQEEIEVRKLDKLAKPLLSTEERRPYLDRLRKRR